MSQRKEFDRIRNWVTSIVIGILVPAFAFAMPIYIVKLGDTLSGILKNQGYPSIYGKKGSLAATLRLNPGMVSSNGDLIHPGEKIALPELKTVEKMASAPVSTDRDPASEPSETDETSSDFSVGLGMDFFRIDATDLSSGSKSVILSTLSPSIQLGWVLHWNSETSFLAEADFERYQLQAPKDATFDHLNGVRGGFSFGVAQRFFDRFESTFSFGLRERLFFHASSLTELAVDQQMIASPMISLRYAVFSKPNAEVGVRGSAGWLMPASNSYYDVKSGIHGALGVYLNRTPKESKHAIECSLDYVIDSQDTSLMNETEKKFIFNLTYRFEE